MDNDVLWQSVLASLEQKLSRPNLITWFRDTRVKKKKGNEITLSVPNIFVKEWLENKFEEELLWTFQKFSPDVKKIKYIIFQQKRRSTKSPASDLSQPRIEFYKNRLSGLNPRYRFDNFVVGSFNQLAHACALSVTKKLGYYNPLFIYSGVGLGKTHLLESIGNKIVESLRKKKAKYIPCPNLTSEIIAGIRSQSIEKIIQDYRHFDVLIIDDIEFLAGKERTQEVFFRVFNDLTENGKQVVLSSDRPPRALEQIEKRLCSRFKGGMVADIGLPNFEERLAILEQKSEERGIILPREILEFIGKSVKNNIRELEGALIKAAVIFEREKNFKTLKQKLKDIIEEPQKRISQEKIIKEVCDFYNITEKQIFSKSRRKEFVLPRQVIMYFLRKELNLSLPSIGIKIGNRDHTTVSYACGKIEEKLKKDRDFLKDIEAIEERLYST